MKITSIRQQAKRQDRYSIFVDGKYAFSLSEGALLDSQLASGQELTKEQLKDFKKQSADDKLYNQALRYVAMRPRSVWEMEIYLKRKQAEEPVAQKILAKLSNIGLLSDAAFARAWVENRRLLKPVSRRRLIQELTQKRVAEEIISKVLAEDSTDEHEALKELAAKKRTQSRYQNDPQKLLNYLARQGFDYSDIKEVLSEN